MLKFIAAIAMVCDHMGVILFPEAEWLRIIGRLAFPIFAYLIAEGSKYTRNKTKHLLTMAGFAAVIQIVYYVYSRSLEMSVMVTFTLSVIIIYALETCKSAIYSKDSSLAGKILTATLFVSTIVLAVAADLTVDLDYGLSGCLLPVFPALLTTPRCENPPEIFKKLDTKLPRVFLFSLGTLALAFDYGGVQFLGLLTIPLLLLYSEKRGRLKMKYFFYVFYPLHLVLLQFIAMLMSR